VSVSSEIADAVTAALNAGEFELEFTAKRKWLARWGLTELAELRVSVVPGPASFEPLDRRRDDQRYDVDIVIQKKLSASLADGKQTEANAEIDPLVGLMEAIVAELRNKHLQAGSVPMICSGRQFIPPGQAAVDAEALRDPRVFSGVVRTSWRRLK
jgi:hypothetical protein